MGWLLLKTNGSYEEASLLFYSYTQLSKTHN